MKKVEKQPTFSKVLLIFDYAIAVILVIVAIIYAFVSDSYSNPMSSMVEVWIGQAAVVSAFYLWKAKCENRSKYTQEWWERIMKDDSISPDKIEALRCIIDNITKD